MGKFDEYGSYDAMGLAELVRKKEVQPLELVDAAIERVERLNPTLNAVITPLFDQARKAAAGDLPQGPFTGVPYLLKDIGAVLGGVRMTMGTAFLQDFIPDHDSELVIRLKRSGLIIVGKTSTPELGILPTTESRFLGRTRNPWNLDRTTGGSSGGAAAAVAARIVPAAHANDGGGSIRIPASCCGVFGIGCATDWSGFRGADIAVEAVVESMEVKQAVLREFEQAARENAIFASNTSSLSITTLAAASNRPGRVVGMHFFNPVEKMPLVEVVRGKQTSPETVAAVATLSRRLGKLPVVVNDGPGFLVNRILMPYLGEALRMLEEGSRIEEIDHSLLAFGMPMGAFILLDEIGIDIASKVSGILRRGLGERTSSRLS